MDRREKLAIYGSLTLMLLFFGAVLVASTAFGVNVPGCVTDVKPFTKSELIKVGENHYELHAIARMWFFDPFEVEIPAGSRLDIFLTSADVTHGFHIAQKNVNMMAVPGQIAALDVRFEEDEIGTYEMLCHEYCGINHHTMQGYLRVRPAGDEPVAMIRTSEGWSRATELSSNEALAEGGVR